MKRCIVDGRRIWLGLQASEVIPGNWVCSKRCWKKVATAIEYGLDFIYLPS
jgi:hypothetical protein